MLHAGGDEDVEAQRQGDPVASPGKVRRGADPLLVQRRRIHVERVNVLIGQTRRARLDAAGGASAEPCEGPGDRSRRDGDTRGRHVDVQRVAQLHRIRNLKTEGILGRWKGVLPDVNDDFLPGIVPSSCSQLQAAARHPVVARAIAVIIRIVCTIPHGVANAIAQRRQRVQPRVGSARLLLPSEPRQSCFLLLPHQRRVHVLQALAVEAHLARPQLASLQHQPIKANI
mmetsp:Transcript_16264/g.37150  ORF Transcript_16264/g.37150 Transcript_16264/m.37150 type:complete len:228 (-) Transcript_16264:3777-4460(-)